MIGGFALVAVPADYRVTGVGGCLPEGSGARFPQDRQEHGALQSGQELATHI